MGNEMIQGSAEWLALRKNHLGASDAPIVMGVSPWRTPFQLWQEKLGMAPAQEETAAMRRGTELEPKARAAFEAETGYDVFPQVVFHPEHSFMMASLDGLSLDGQVAVEIKCTSSKYHKMALNGEVPEHYYPQLQHQLACLGVDMLYYFSFDGYSGAIVEVKRDERYITKLIKEELKFWRCIKEKVPPNLTDKDYVERSDESWIRCAEKLCNVDKELSHLQELRESLKQELVGMAKGQSSKGGGLTLSKSLTKGSVDYSKIPELEGVDLEPYRKETRETWRLNLERK